MSVCGALSELDCWIDNMVKDARTKLGLEPAEIQLALLSKVQNMMIVSLTHSGKWEEYEKARTEFIKEADHAT